jgi:peptide/nickel transport system permease protein
MSIRSTASAATQDDELGLAGAAGTGTARTMVRPSPGIYRRAIRRFRRDHLAMASLAVALVIVVFTLAAPLVSDLTGFTYAENHLGDKLANPGEKGYILGSDGNGRDILTRLAYGGRISLLVAVFATLSELSLGLGFGLFAGYHGRWIDSIIMRIVDVMLSIPGLPLLILISTLYSPGYILLAVIIGAINWPADARLLRGEVLALRGREYIEAARVVGVPPRSIILRHLLPNVTPILLVQASLTIPSVILAEAALSFLGLGVQVPTPSWGNMLDEAQRFYRQQWQNVFIPGLMIYISALCLYLVGIGLRDALDPRLTD